MKKVRGTPLLNQPNLIPCLVLRYLESMRKEGEEPDNLPPRSIIDAEEYRHSVGSQRNSRLASSVKSKSVVDKIEEADDGDSVVQQGERSEIGDPPVR